MPQVEKEQFRNESGGYVGVVTLTSRGDDKGMPVAPGDTVWLSEDEQVLTANAPRLAEHNPFVPQKVIQRNPETDAQEETWVTPLVKVNEARFVPADARPIGSNAPAAPAPEAPPEAPEPAPAPPVAQAPAERPPAPIPGPSAPTPPAADPELVIPADEGRVAEEVAAVSPGPGHEETGAALPPAAPAPEGEYRAGEEVGTPTAPSGDAPASSSPPPAWTPETEG